MPLHHENIAHLEEIQRSSGRCCGEMSSELRRVRDYASDQVRKNPLSMMAGAVAFGVALGCLVMASGHEDKTETLVLEPLEEARDALANISHSLGRILGSLKFW